MTWISKVMLAIVSLMLFFLAEIDYFTAHDINFYKLFKKKNDEF